MRVVINLHPVETVHRRPATHLLPEVRAEIVLARQDDHLVVVARLHDFVEGELVFDAPEARAPARDNILPHLARGRPMPERNATIDVFTGVALPDEVAAAIVFDTCREPSATQELR